MSKFFNTIGLATMLGLGTLGLASTGASAAAIPLFPAVSGQASAAGDGIVQVDYKWKKKKWKNNNWNGNWNNNNNNWKYRKHRRGYDNGVYLSLPLIIGGAYAANSYYGNDYYDYDDDYYDGGRLTSRHVRYCLNKYRSYNPRNNTWVAYSGQVKKCYSPYL